MGATLFVLLGAPVCDESHVLVEPDRLRVLLIHSEFADVVMGDAVFKQLLADAVSTMIGVDEQHFEPSIGDAHERKGRPVRVVAVGVYDDQLRYFGDGLRYVLLDAISLIVGQKRMRRANRTLPHRDQVTDERGVAMFAMMTASAVRLHARMPFSVVSVHHAPLSWAWRPNGRIR